MEKELYEVMQEYVINKKKLDLVFVDKVISIVINNNNLQNYLKKLNIVTKDKSIDTIVHYVKEKLTLDIYVKNFGKYSAYQSLYDLKLNKSEEEYLKCIIMIADIIRELEFANQKKLMKESIGFDVKLLRLENRSMDYEKFFHQIFDEVIVIEKILNPKIDLLSTSNRLANINTTQEILRVVDNKSEMVKIKILMLIKLLEYSLYGYESTIFGIVSPMIKYMKFSGNSTALEDFSWYSPNFYQCLENVKKIYNFEERLKYGLPIDNDEYEYLIDIYEKTKVLRK